MFAVDNYGKHACYLIDLLYRREPQTLWHAFFEDARNFALKEKWDRARQAIQEAQELARRASTSADSLDPMYGAIELLFAFSYIGEGKLADAFQHYAYARETFIQNTEDYGLAVTLFAIGLYYQAQHKLREAYASYDHCLAQLRKPLPSDHTLRRMRIDVSARRAEVQAQMFSSSEYPLVKTPPPTSSPPASANSPSSDSHNGQGSTEAVSLASALKKEYSGKSTVEPEPDGKDKTTPLDARGFIDVFPIVQKASAGPGIWHDSAPASDTYAEIDSLLIHDQRYRIEPLLRSESRVLPLSRSAQYVLFLVEGDSMNAAKLNEGDYVLVEEISLIPSPAYNGDIVLTHLYPGDKEQVVIKRFECDETRVKLSSENKEHKYGPQTYRLMDVVPLGKVVAVLKKVE